MCSKWKMRIEKEAKKELAKEIAKEMIDSTSKLGNNKPKDFITGHQTLKGEIDRVLSKYLK